MAYEDNERTVEEVSIKVKRFTLKGLPVCFSWYGDDAHDSEICEFHLARKFGTISVCGLTLKDLQCHEGTTLTKPEGNCPVWRKREKEEQE